MFVVKDGKEARKLLLPCTLSADTEGGRVVEMATGVAKGMLLPALVRTFT